MAEGGEHPTPYYPVSLDVTGRPCLVVGGGPVAARKARGLLSCGATVTVITPEVSPDMAALDGITIERRTYATGDAGRFRLVVTATGRPDVDAAVFTDAEVAGVWVNSADDREHCTVILPSIHRDGPVTVAVSTGGVSPALASWLRRRLAAAAGEAGTLAELLGQARAQLKAAGISTETVDWAALLDGPLPALVDRGELDNARAILQDATGVATEK
jgi:precorrin-2 dehydrogenase / sirohydrochlorin ferrochelatase